MKTPVFNTEFNSTANTKDVNYKNSLDSKRSDKKESKFSSKNDHENDITVSKLPMKEQVDLS